MKCQTKYFDLNKQWIETTRKPYRYPLPICPFVYNPHTLFRSRTLCLGSDS
jgi:hypothetical protein